MSDLRRRISSGTFVVLLVLGPGLAWADPLPGVSSRPPWKLSERIDAPDGYELYKREVQDSDFTAYRLEATIDAPARLVAEAFRRNVRDPEVSPSNIRKTILRREEDVVFLHSYIEMPLVSDRDVNTRGQGLFDPETGIHRFEWRETDEGPPPQEGVVRLPKSRGSAVFTPLPDGRTRVVYESHVDIGGAIPAWVVNGLMSGAVVESLVLLRDRVESDRTRMAGEPREGTSEAQ